MSALPAWARWREGPPYTVGAEEEVMLLDPGSWALAQQAGRVMEGLSPALRPHAGEETHRSALELRTEPHARVPELAAQLRSLRELLRDDLAALGLVAGASGTHPTTTWRDTEVSLAPRYQLLHETLKGLARREPTFGLHLHVAVPDAEDAVRLLNRLRTHVPLLLALSANSPFWQGRDSGLRSARTPLFQGFPRVGLPRAFRDYRDWVGAVDLLLRCDAFPEPSFLWWDVRLQPRFGTVELRVLDAQTTVEDTAALTAFVQSLERAELSGGVASRPHDDVSEVLDENRFLAARDGMDAGLLDADAERAVPARRLLAQLMDACRDHARDLGCERELEGVRELAARSGADRQRNRARRAGIGRMIEATSTDFAPVRTAGRGRRGRFGTAGPMTGARRSAILNPTA